MSEIVFVTGGSSLVGRRLISRLVTRGSRVVALARSPEACEAVGAAGAEPVLGDITRPEGWIAEARACDLVFHLALPRLRPPVRRSRIGRLQREAASGAAALRAAVGAGRPLVMASTGLVYGSRTAAAAEDDPVAPVALGRPAFEAERALADPELRVVRLGWVYGEEGMVFDLITALRIGRLRVVGPGDNRWALISASDAADALLAAADGPSGVYNAAEPGSPTQVDVIHHVCGAVGLRRPDHLPPRMAALSLGGASAEALAASMDLRVESLTALGWCAAGRWERDLPALLGGGRVSPALGPRSAGG
jgi:nucleoside-diphosphate-sugar epimerase